MKTFYWLVKREFWEHKGGFVTAPIVAGAIAFLLNAMLIAVGEAHTGIGNFHSNFSRAYEDADLVQAGAVIDGLLYGMTYLVLIVTAIVVFFYCLGALYDDRRDRSILFWKSLPLSDTDTVLSKVASAVLLAPAVAMVVGVVTGLMLAIMFALVGAYHGLSIWPLLMQAHPIKVIVNLVLLIPLYAIWALPTVGWLMLCSAWARSKPFLWAIALPLGSAAIVGWMCWMAGVRGVALNYMHYVTGRLLGGLVPAGWVTEASSLAGLDTSNPAAALDKVNLAYHYSTLAQPSVWIGAIAGIAMIAGAIWFRRWRDDS